MCQSGFATRRNDFPLRSSIVELSSGSAVSSPEPKQLELDLSRFDQAAKPLIEYESVRTWFDGLRPSLSYRRHGLTYLREFCRYVGKDPDELTRERKARLQQDRDARVEERWLDKWHQEVLQSGAMASTAQGRYR